MLALQYGPTPIQRIEHPDAAAGGIRLLVKREDLNHPLVSGNKWWKLLHNLEEVLRHGHHTILTFGGAYSNHLYAAAAAAKILGLKSIGIVRGEETMPLNSTLSFAKTSGMQLHYVDRETYRRKSEPVFLQALAEQFGPHYLVPEGGTNEHAVRGCSEWAKQLERETTFDYCCLAAGTGGTAAGLLRGLSASKDLVVFPVLKGGQFLQQEIQSLAGCSRENWSVQTDYHFGGYGKWNQELINFMQEMLEVYQLPLDRVYTAKVFYGVLDLIRSGYFRKDSTVLMLHTGGLQAEVN